MKLHEEKWGCYIIIDFASHYTITFFSIFISYNDVTNPELKTVTLVQGARVHFKRQLFKCMQVLEVM